MSNHVKPIAARKAFTLMSPPHTIRNTYLHFAKPWLSISLSLNPAKCNSYRQIWAPLQGNYTSENCCAAPCRALFCWCWWLETFNCRTDWKLHRSQSQPQPPNSSSIFDSIFFSHFKDTEKPPVAATLSGHHQRNIDFETCKKPHQPPGIMPFWLVMVNPNERKISNIAFPVTKHKEKNLRHYFHSVALINPKSVRFLLFGSFLTVICMYCWMIDWPNQSMEVFFLCSIAWN